MNISSAAGLPEPKTTFVPPLGQAAAGAARAAAGEGGELGQLRQRGRLPGGGLGAAAAAGTAAPTRAAGVAAGTPAAGRP